MSFSLEPIEIILLSNLSGLGVRKLLIPNKNLISELASRVVPTCKVSHKDSTTRPY